MVKFLSYFLKYSSFAPYSLQLKSCAAVSLLFVVLCSSSALICNPLLLHVLFCFSRRLFCSTISPFDCFYDVLSSFIAHSVSKSAKFPFTSFHCNFFDIFHFMFCIFHVHQIFCIPFGFHKVSEP